MKGLAVSLNYSILLLMRKIRQFYWTTINVGDVHSSLIGHPKIL